MEGGAYLSSGTERDDCSDLYSLMEESGGCEERTFRLDTEEARRRISGLGSALEVRRLCLVGMTRDFRRPVTEVAISSLPLKDVGEECSDQVKSGTSLRVGVPARGRAAMIGSTGGKLNRLALPIPVSGAGVSFEGQRMGESFLGASS